MARKSTAKSKSEIMLPPEARIEQLLATFSNRTNDEILDFMAGEPEFLRCIPDDKKRAEKAKATGIDVPDFDKIGRQRLQEHIRNVRHKWDRRMGDISELAESMGDQGATFFDDIAFEDIERFSIDGGAIDHIFGDGLTPGLFGPVLGKTYLIGGDEGVGKTRTCIDFVGKVSDPERKDIAKLCKARDSKAAVVYFQNEVPEATFKQWGKGKIKTGARVMVSEKAQLQAQLALIESVKPLAVFVDSLHMILECDNSSGVIRTLNVYRAHAMAHGYTLILICHLNKAGDVAGSRKLSYLVDCVIKAQASFVPGQFTFGCPKKNRYGRTGHSVLCQHSNEGVIIVNSERGRVGDEASFGGPKPLIVLAPNAKPLPKPKIDPEQINKKHIPSDDPDNGKKGSKKKKGSTAAETPAAVPAAVGADQDDDGGDED